MLTVLCGTEAIKIVVFLIQHFHYETAVKSQVFKTTNFLMTMYVISIVDYM